MGQARIDERDWSVLSRGDQFRQLEAEGYVLLPGLLSPAQIQELKSETARLPTKAIDYSVHQRYFHNVQFVGGPLTALIGNPPLIGFLRDVFGAEVIMMHYAYARSEPGHPGISLHTDGQPYGSKIFGYEGSCPFLVRVLYYLDDLTKEVSPFRVVPHSHLSMHADGNPYLRYQAHPEEVMVPAKAGSAILIHHRVFHGNFPNTGDRPRELLAIAYRPAWAGPVAQVDEWDPAELEKVPSELRGLFGSRNRRDWDFDGVNKPAGMANQAPGINPSRWERK